MNKRILIVSNFFYPTQNPRSFRTTELANELARQGNEVVIYIPCNGYDYSHMEEKYGYKIHDLGKPLFNSLTLKGNKVLVLFKRVFYRLMLMLFEFPDIQLVYQVNKALKKERGYDTLISIAYPHPIHWGVATLNNKNKRLFKTWIADCGDPYMGANLDSFKKLFYFKYIEKWFCKKADYITIPKIEMKKNYYSEFDYKIKEIPQGFNFEELNFLNSEIKNDVPTFAFAGTLMRESRDPKLLLNYLKTTNKDFKFYIFTQHGHVAEPYLNGLNGKVEIRSYIPRQELLQFLSKMDFLVNLEYDPVHQSPSKLIDYAITGRPILSVVSAEFNSNVIDAFLEGDYSNKFVVENIEKYNIKNVSSQFLNLS